MLKKELEQELNRTKLILDYAKQEIKEKGKEIERLQEENLLLKASEPMSKLAEDYGYKAEAERLNNIIVDINKILNDDDLCHIEKLQKINKALGSDKE